MQVSRILIYYHIVILSSKDSKHSYCICEYSLFKLIILDEDFIEINSIDVDHDQYMYKFPFDR